MVVFWYYQFIYLKTVILVIGEHILIGIEGLTIGFSDEFIVVFGVR